MSLPSAATLLRRHVLPFVASLAGLTFLLVANFVSRRVVDGGGLREGLETVLFAIPFTAAMTLPMAVFIAVTWVFVRLGEQGVLSAVRREGVGVLRFAAPVLGASAVVASVALASNAELVPRANARLLALQSGRALATNDRTMTIEELRNAAAGARAEGAPSLPRATAYEVEIQKKYALAAACLVLALAGIASALLFPRGGTRLVIGASCLVFSAYYLLVVSGETLADGLVLSPLVAMWMANVMIGVVAATVLLRARGAGSPRGQDSLAVGT